MKPTLFFLMLTFFALPTFAKSEDEVNLKALQDTQQLLRNKSAREKELNSHGSKSAVQNMRNLTQGDAQLEEDMWSIAADIMPMLVEKTNGDPKKMLELLENAKRDPAGFAAQFKGPEQAKLKDVAEKIHKRSGPKKP
jgi:hypothetical protein